MEIFKEPPLQKAPVFRKSTRTSAQAGANPTEREDDRREQSIDNRVRKSSKYGSANAFNKETGVGDHGQTRTTSANAREHRLKDLKIPQGYTRDRNAEKFSAEHERVFKGPIPGNKSTYDNVYISVGRDGVVLSNKHPKQQVGECSKVNPIGNTERVDAVTKPKSPSITAAGSHIGHLGDSIAQGKVYYTHHDSSSNARYYGDRPSFSAPIAGGSDRTQLVASSQESNGKLHNVRKKELGGQASAQIVGKMERGKEEDKSWGWGG